ncbi:hypothetical protein [Priestia taiwanensis]|uniref:Uncharacterized protein n=1 Tax=Priestia taiwanensis TaxID=1347902 RepID=A0A917EPI6_9BACI|nr:hypothetical protein [Priestia taiwanensis]MBM7363049.1 putative membrane protein [Priestia taiwanensis]GGE67187.1 hypothetical protein GCM10007140_16700 [Priestia taiwanensis]
MKSFYVIGFTILTEVFLTILIALLTGWSYTSISFFVSIALIIGIFWLTVQGNIPLYNIQYEIPSKAGIVDEPETTSTTFSPVLQGSALYSILSIALLFLFT